MVADEYVNIDELTECVIIDMSQNSDEVVQKSREAAVTARNQMKPMVENKSPVQQYQAEKRT